SQLPATLLETARSRTGRSLGAGAAAGALRTAARQRMTDNTAHLHLRFGTLIDPDAHGITTHGPLSASHVSFAASHSSRKTRARSAGLKWAFSPLGLGRSQSRVSPMVSGWGPSVAFGRSNATR